MAFPIKVCSGTLHLSQSSQGPARRSWSTKAAHPLRMRLYACMQDASKHALCLSRSRYAARYSSTDRDIPRPSIQLSYFPGRLKKKIDLPSSAQAGRRLHRHGSLCTYNPPLPRSVLERSTCRLEGLPPASNPLRPRMRTPLFCSAVFGDVHKRKHLSTPLLG